MAKSIMQKVGFMNLMLFQFRNWKLETNMIDNWWIYPLPWNYELYEICEN